MLDWISGSYQAIKIATGIKADQDMGKCFLKGQKSNALWIVDLGFWNTAFFNSISKAGSFFLSRLHGQSSVNIKEHKYLNFNLDIFLSKIPRDEVFEFCVYLGLEHKVKSRLICLPVPKEIADLRRKRLKEAYSKRGKTPSAKTLKRLDWALFVTNVPYSILPTSTIYTIYRIRWQVELTFKLAKQDAQIDHTLSHNPNRVMCEFYARLIALLQFKNLLKLLPQNSLHLVSCPKSWRSFKLDALDFFRCLPSSKFPSLLYWPVSSNGTKSYVKRSENIKYYSL